MAVLAEAASYSLCCLALAQYCSRCGVAKAVAAVAVAVAVAIVAERSRVSDSIATTCCYNGRLAAVVRVVVTARLYEGVAVLCFSRLEHTLPFDEVLNKNNNVEKH
jgi:hypothetical protein